MPITWVSQSAITWSGQSILMQLPRKQTPSCHSWALRRNLKGCPEKLRETAYFSLVRSFLEYSATVWHPHQKYNSDKLEMVQRRAARFVKGRYGMYESVTQMLEELTWVPLSKRCENARLILFYKIINNLAMVPHSWLEKGWWAYTSLHFKTLDIILCYHNLEKRRLIGRVPMTLIGRQRLCAHTSYCLWIISYYVAFIIKKYIYDDIKSVVLCFCIVCRVLI